MKLLSTLNWTLRLARLTSEQKSTFDVENSLRPDLIGRTSTLAAAPARNVQMRRISPPCTFAWSAAERNSAYPALCELGIHRGECEMFGDGQGAQFRPILGQPNASHRYRHPRD